MPVLSEHMTFVQPRVSTAGRCRTIARWRAIFLTPRASTIVTTAGSPSGIAATARLMDIINISSGGTFCIMPSINISAHIPRAAVPSMRPVLESPF